MTSRLFLATTVLALLVPAAAIGAGPAWLQHAPNGVLMARAVVDSGTCPSVTIGTAATPMMLRADNSDSYSIRVCEAVIPPESESASIEGVVLPVADARQPPRRIAIVGDTGCRVKCRGPGDCTIQDCADPDKWPFAQIAAKIAAWDPDLIIHLGDYNYREYDCPTPTTCTGPSYGWSQWKADFFDPAASLLIKAPWIFVRGNHETCGRAAEGWFRLLDGGRYSYEDTAQCISNLEYTPPYAVATGDLQIMVVDSSSFSDTDKFDPDQLQVFVNQLAALQRMQRPHSKTWLVQHHPIWGILAKKGGKSSKASKPVFASATPVLDQAWASAAKSGKAPAIDLVLSGHKHLVETISFGAAPLQLVIGTGGTELEHALKGDPTGFQFSGRRVSTFATVDQFGFAAATPGAEGMWSIDINLASGEPQIRCMVGGHDGGDCRQVKGVR